MADFVGVIKKAVDGLKDNTPEARSKIYERARQTITRQLEAMSGTLSPALLQTQIQKIDDAIAEVEREYTGATPDLDTKPAEPDLRGAPIAEPPVQAQDVQLQDIQDKDIQPEDIQAQEVDVPSAQANEQFSKPFVTSKDSDVAPPVMPKADPFEEPVSGSSDGGEIASDQDAPESLADAPMDSVAQEPEPIDQPYDAQASIQDEVKTWVTPDDAAQTEFLDDAATVQSVDTPKIGGSSNELVGSEQDSLDEIFKVDSGREDQAAQEAISDFTSNDTSELDTVSDVVESHDSVFGLGEEALSAPPELPQKKSSKFPIVIIVALVLLLFVAIAYGIWRVDWDSFTSEDAPTGGEVIGEAQQQIDDSPADNVSEQTDVPANNSDANDNISDEKFTQRLNIDGTEVDEGPSNAGDPNDFTEGSSVSLKSDAGNIGSDQSESDTASAPQPQGTQIAQKMLLYEERLGQTQESVIDGQVVWSVQNNTDGNNEPFIQADITVPERGVTAIMSIKRNSDATLPASHVIEFLFGLPDDFDGGEVEQIQSLSFKDVEGDTGNALIAVAAKITPDFFIVALNNVEEAINVNENLMRKRPWIDIPIAYTNGRRALLTLEKGTSGTEIFEKVFQTWEQNPL